MWTLLFSTIGTSAADSINPIAISQQFVLQGMVKKTKHIWFFIISIAVTNFFSGLLAYFGLIAPISNFVKQIIKQYGQSVFTLELIIGIGFLVAVGHSLQNKKITELKNQIPNFQFEMKDDEQKAKSRIKSVSPLSLTILGIVATLSELTSAFPYFAFLAILFQYKLSLFSVTGILILYNFIYSLPLIILYFIYIKAQNKFDSFYIFIKTKMEKWAAILLPIVFGIIGTLLIFHAIAQF